SFAEHVGVGMECIAPEGIGEDDGALGIGAIIAWSEQPAEYRLEPHYFEIMAVDYAAANFARLAEADHGEVYLREGAQFGDGVQVFTHVHNLGDGEGAVLVAVAGCALADVKEAVFVTVIEWTQQDAANHAEDGSVRADAEGERERHGDPERRDARKRPDRYLQ